jgi:hypothetical protein
MSHRADDEFADYGSSFESVPLQPVMTQVPAAPVPPSPRGEALRSSLLKKPLDAALGTPQPQPARPSFTPPPPRFR